MNKKLKCIALSALVLPGLGQLYLGRKVKGGVLLLLDNVFILAALFAVLRCAGKLLAAGPVGVAETGKLLETIQRDAPMVRWILMAFLLVWSYAVVDAALDKGHE